MQEAKAKSISYPPDIEATISRLVDSGRDSDPVFALRSAVRLLEERDRQDQFLLAKLQVCIDQADRGEVYEWTSDLRDRLLREADEMFLCGEEPHPIVLQSASFGSHGTSLERLYASSALATADIGGLTNS